MRTVTLAVAFVVWAGSASAQQLPAVPVLPPAEPFDGLPGGAPVSRPLQAAELPPEPPAKAKVDPKPEPVAVEPVPKPVEEFIEPDRNPGPRKILGGHWGSSEILVWWAKGHPVPVLATGGRNSPTESVLLGGSGPDNQDIAGYRVRQGYSLDHGDRVGFEGSYFFVGTRTVSDFATNVTRPRSALVGLPYTNAITGEPDVLTIARPGQMDALVNLFTTTRIQGAEANLIGNLFARPGAKIHAIAGYRFLQVNEGLHLRTRWMQRPTPESGFYQTLGMTGDQFDGRNEFHGGQIGLIGDFHRGPFYVEVTGKVAFGTNYQVVNVSGETHLITASLVPLYRSYLGGVYSQPTNIGRATQSVFAVVPEASFKVGLKYGEANRFYIGYNFLYLDTAVRPGDQIDRTINPTLISSINPGGAFVGPDRPQLGITTTNFWVQGLLIGFEHRF